MRETRNPRRVFKAAGPLMGKALPAGQALSGLYPRAGENRRPPKRRVSSR